MLNSSDIQAHRSDCSVTLVEDDDSLRRNVKALLEMRGFQVIACASANEFYRSYAARPTPLVVLDIGLDGEDGLSICDYLRTHNPLLGIVMMTARGMQDDRIAGLMKGADAYLVKPVELDELVVTLNRLDSRVMSSTDPASTMVPGRPSLSPASAVESAPVLSSSVTEGHESCTWWFNLSTSILTGPNGKTRRLVGNERNVIYCMAQRPGQPVSLDDLFVHLAIQNTPEGKRRTEVIISRLRRNVLASIGVALPLYLLRGTGYFLRDVLLDEVRPTRAVLHSNVEG